MIDFTPEAFEEFKKLYLKAIHKNKIYFMYDGQYIYVEFAKYVIQNYSPKNK